MNFVTRKIRRTISGKMLSYENFSSERTPFRNVCLLSVLFAFTIGLFLGVLIPLAYVTTKIPRHVPKNHTQIHNGSIADRYVDDGIYWGRRVEKSLPQGFQRMRHASWNDYIRTTRTVKMEEGCGRMQNRLITFGDGRKACVRYRQNTDQIQGELFSFYLAQILGLTNIVPSAVTLVDLKHPLWKDVTNEIASAQWNSNRPVVLTEFVNDLESAPIPKVIRPNERHLNRNDISNATNPDKLIELAQWSDLIVFDYLTANLDRVVNNLYNFQWNSNIMDAPAHNLARKENLLVFLDNESGLLHGYRLLKKYEVYHSLLLDSLCIFRRNTVQIIKTLRDKRNVGKLLRSMFEEGNGPHIQDVLPSLPDKSVKILNERVERVYGQIERCQAQFGLEN